MFFLQYSENKSYCEDLTEGKFSFPVIHAIRSKPDDPQVIRILFNSWFIFTIDIYGLEPII